MREFWQYIPESIDPIAFSMAGFSLRWYAVFFLLGWMFASLTFLWIGKKEGIKREVLVDMALFGFLAVLLGGRLGYAIFYDQNLLLHPLLLVFPFDASGAWRGIWGMSFFGAFAGFVVFLLIFSRIRQLDFWRLSDAVALSTPVALFFGRIGNFVNGELFGRVTDIPWGMRFHDALLRHPSQLYEAFFEGVVLFVFLLVVSRKSLVPGFLAWLFIGSYSLVRFSLEFFREPDAGSAPFFGWITMGQMLSLVVFFVAIFWFFFERKYGMMEKRGK